MATRRRPPDQRTGDPRLKTRSWRAIVKHWRGVIERETKQGGAVYCQATPCRLPGAPVVVGGGPRTKYHLVVGHKIPRLIDTRLTWDIDDTRPEHDRCSTSHGSAIGNTQRWAKARTLSNHEEKQKLTISNNDW